MNTALDSPARAPTGGLNGCFLGSILLEPRRWQRERPPVIRLADWLERIRSAGFEGVEVWEPHWTHATDEERRRIQASGLRFILNSYASLDDADQATRAAATAAAAALHSEDVKFNLGRDPERLAAERAMATHWAETLPPGCRLLCECHADTLAETPSAAADLARYWDPARIGFVVHPFFTDNLGAWMEALLERIVHLHIQTRAADNVHRFVTLAERRSHVASRWRLLASRWPGGTATIEFTAGMGNEGVATASLLACARADAQVVRRLATDLPVEWEAVT